VLGRGPAIDDNDSRGWAVKIEEEEDMSDEKEKSSETSEIGEDALEQVVGGVSLPVSVHPQKLIVPTVGGGGTGGEVVRSWDVTANDKV